MSLTDLDRFKAACVYPSKLDEQAVERELAAYLQALGMSRRIVRLRAGSRPEDDTPVERNIEWILAESIKRNLRVPAVPAFRPFHATQDDGAAFPCDVLSYRVARAALDALAARRASDAGAADAALPRRDALGRFFAFPGLAVLFALLAAFLGAVAVAVLAGLAALAAVAASVARIAFFDADVRADLAGVTLIALITGGSVVALAPTDPALVCLAVAALAEVAVLLDRRDGAARAFAGFAADPGARALRTNRRGSMWELSWTVCMLFDAVERRKPAVEAWLRPLFEAFVGGCWLLYWADDTLYWVAKPTVRCEPGARRLRLHHEAHAALESDVASLYFWHGVRVPRFVIVRPDLITISRIHGEATKEVRRAMIERYRHGEEIHGAAAFIRDAGAERLDHDERYGTLWRRRFRGNEFVQGDEPIVMIEMVKRTPEPDGSFKRYWLRVPPKTRTAREAVAWTFNMPAERYAPEIET